MQAFVALAEIPAELDFDGFLDRMRTSGPSKVELERVSDDELPSRELHSGECVCPQVRQQVIPLDPKLCICGATWVCLLVERHARRSAAVTLVESVATGADNCVYGVMLGNKLPARGSSIARRWPRLTRAERTDFLNKIGDADALQMEVRRTGRARLIPLIGREVGAEQQHGRVL